MLRILKLFKPLKLLFIGLLINLFIISCSIANTEIIHGNNSKDVKIPIILYHNVAEVYDESLSYLHISPSKFEQQMMTLKNEGYTAITFEDYYNFIINNKALPESPIIITFDDGYSSNYQYAYPILEKLNMKATIFVITGSVGEYLNVSYPHFTWEQAREMQESAVIDIQSHSENHNNMTELNDVDMQLELRRSRYIIQKELNKSCDVFAYPYGLSNENVQGAAENAGYKVQVIVGDKGVNGKATGLKQVKRLTVSGDMSGQQLIEMIENNMDIK